MRRRSFIVTTCRWMLIYLFWVPIKYLFLLLKFLLTPRPRSAPIVYEQDYVEQDEVDNEQELMREFNKYTDLPEIPEMAQIYNVDRATLIGVQYVSMCPDETAHIRIIGDTSFSQIYKRKVYVDKTFPQRRYFKLNNEKYYLDDSKTQPIQPTQAKKGK